MILKRVYRRIVSHWWRLAFIETPISDILQGREYRINYLNYPFHGRWFADPFILDYNDEEIVLLVEDYSDTDKVGKISRLVIDRASLELKDVRVILESDSHLSFPAIIRKDGKVFIYPENGAAKTLNLYALDKDTKECRKECQLSDEALADSIISDYWGDRYMFSTKSKGNVLDIYKYDEGKRKFVDFSKIVFDENIGRNGGDFFEVKGQLYRAAQECNYMYGHAISLQQIKKEGNQFKIEEVRRLLPPKHAIGMHTFNIYKNLIVVDLKVFRYPLLAWPLFKLRTLFKSH